MAADRPAFRLGLVGAGLESAGVHNAVGFNYRRLPAVALIVGARLSRGRRHGGGLRRHGGLGGAAAVGGGR